MSEYADPPAPPGDGLDQYTRGKLGALETLKELGPLYAKAKADRSHVEFYRKSKKALLMIEAERDHGHKSAAMQERYAYAHDEYVALLDGLHAAIEEETRLEFRLKAADAAIRVWQTRAASARVEHRVLP